MPIFGQHRYLQTVHRPISYEFADDTARLLGTGYDIIADDLLKFAHQQDTDEVWILTGVSPLTWIRVGGGAGSTIFLSTEADQFLEVVGGNTIYLDTQAVNTVFAGPESGADDEPYFRQLAHSELYLPPNDEHHAPVTLSTEANTVLQLSSQQIDLDTQADNTFFAGPASAGPTKPTFRAIGMSDLATLEITKNVIVPISVGWNITDGVVLEFEEDTIDFIYLASNYISIILPDNKHSSVFSVPFAIPADLKSGTDITVSALYLGGTATIDVYGKLERTSSLLDCSDFSATTGTITGAGVDGLDTTKCLRQGTVSLANTRFVQFKYARDGANVLDTAGDIEIGGFLVTYTATR